MAGIVKTNRLWKLETKLISKLLFVITGNSLKFVEIEFLAYRLFVSFHLLGDLSIVHPFGVKFFLCVVVIFDFIYSVQLLPCTVGAIHRFYHFHFALRYFWASGVRLYNIFVSAALRLLFSRTEKCCFCCFGRLFLPFRAIQQNGN